MFQNGQKINEKWMMQIGCQPGVQPQTRILSIAEPP